MANGLLRRLPGCYTRHQEKCNRCLTQCHISSNTSLLFTRKAERSALMRSSYHQGDWVETLLGDHNFQRKKGFLHWWYTLTSSREPEQPTLTQRDVARRSK